MKKGREWYNAPELAQLSLPGLPRSEYGIRKKAKREDWEFRKAWKGKGHEYHIESLPHSARAALLYRAARLEAKSHHFQPKQCFLLLLVRALLVIRSAIDRAITTLEHHYGQ